METMKLNIGCWETRIPGYSNLDIRKDVDVDIVGDCRDLSQFSDCSIDAIHASNVYEHIPLVENQKVMNEWGRVLKKGGILHISVPDWDFCVRNYLKTGVLTRWHQNLLWGDQVGEFTYHYAAYAYPNLRGILDLAGFSKVRRISDMPFKLKDASTLRDSWFNDPVALNIEAIK